MDTTKSNFINAAALCFCFIGGLWFAGNTENQPVNIRVNGEEVEKGQAKKGHQCDWAECDYVGLEIFVTEQPEGSDMYFFEKTHFDHPDMPYEELESYMWSVFEHEPRTM